MLDRDSLIVVFSDVVDKESATDRNNYYMKDEDNKKIAVTSAVLDEYDEDHKFKRVIIKVPAMKDYHEYQLYVDDVENIFKTARVENYVTDLGEGMTNDEEISLDSYDVINRTLIQLKFDAPLDKDSEKASIYVNGSSVKKKMIDPDNAKILNVYLNKSRSLKEDKEYDLKIKKGGIEDIYGNTHKDEILEEIDGTNELPNEVTIESAKFISDSQILIKFTDLLRETSLEADDNYAFEYHINGTEKKLFPGKIKVVDAKTVIIDFPYLVQGGKLYVKINDMYDVSSQYQYDGMSEKVEMLEK